jgi:hypothetical protein
MTYNNNHFLITIKKLTLTRHKKLLNFDNQKMTKKR